MSHVYQMMYSNGPQIDVETVSIKIPRNRLTPIEIPELDGVFNRDLLLTFRERKTAIQECNNRLESLSIYAE